MSMTPTSQKIRELAENVRWELAAINHDEFVQVLLRFLADSVAVSGVGQVLKEVLEDHLFQKQRLTTARALDDLAATLHSIERMAKGEDE